MPLDYLRGSSFKSGPCSLAAGKDCGWVGLLCECWLLYGVGSFELYSAKELVATVALASY